MAVCAQKVLIVDDETPVREFLNRILAAEYQLFFAANGLEAYELLQAGEYDCLVTDILMDKMSGLELIELLHRENRDLPIVVISGYLAGVQEKFLSGLIRAFVSKPFSPDQIKRAIQHALTGTGPCQAEFLAGENLPSAEVSSQNLAVLLDVARMLNSTVELASLFSLIMQLAAKTLEAERSALMLVDHDTQELWSMVGVGIGRSEIRIPINSGIAGEVVAGNKALIINDPYSHPSFNPEVDKQTGFTTRNLICIPIQTVNGDILGVVEVLNKISGEFNQSDVRLLEAFAGPAGTAIENAMLHEEQKRQYDELQEAYSKLRQAQEQIIHQEKLASIGQVSAGIAHEVKNQLFCLSLLKLVQEDYPDDEDLQHNVNMIIASRDRILHIVDSIRDYSKKKVFDKNQLSLAALLQEVLEFVKLDMTVRYKKLTCRLPADDSLYVLGNDDKLRQVFINLIRNAAQATGNDGRIDISVTRAGDALEMVVADNGCGIPAEIKDRIFEPFFTTKGEEGTGLGLDICRQIIEGHDGSIGFESSPETGTRFMVRIPAHEPEEE